MGFLYLFIMTMEAIRSYMLSNGNKLLIYPDENPEDPRNWDNIGKLCIMEHRNYNFPNELIFDFYTDCDGENVEDRIKELEKTHYLFWLDMYEHSWIVFSFTWVGIKCNFDTSCDCWFIAVPMGEDKLTGHICTGYEDALSIAKNELKEYNAYGSGNVYWYVVQKEHTYTREDGVVKKEWETEDSVRWYYELDDMLAEFKDLNPVEID